MIVLDRLRLQLKEAAVPSLERGWSIDLSIDDHIRKLRKFVDGGGPALISQDLQEAAIRQFWCSLHLDGFRDARLVSFGLIVPVVIDGARNRIIDDAARFPKVLEAVDGFRGNVRQFRRCYQGFLAAYFGFDEGQEAAAETAVSNWTSLKAYLLDRANGITVGGNEPGWVMTILQHRNLLSTDPCSRYGAALLDGDKQEVDDLRDVLSIPDSSWFTRRLFLAQIQSATEREDEGFEATVERLLELLRSNRIIRDTGLTLILDRYARMSRPPAVNVLLRNFAVDAWGNPWLTAFKTAWGNVSEGARALVTDWLKLHLIERFFTLLAEERQGDRRRLNFWKRYVSSIRSIHFGLGADAQSAQSVDFVQLRRELNGIWVGLDDINRANNAFIMNMGDVVIVEFGNEGNACYWYSTSRALPFDPRKRLQTRVGATNSLKHNEPIRVHKLRHSDCDRSGRWENRFARELRQFGILPDALSTPPGTSKIASQPAYASTLKPTAIHPSQPQSSASRRLDEWLNTPFSTEALDYFAHVFGLRVEDFSRHGGNLWVRTDDRNQRVGEVLEHWKFRYRAGKGWWR
jgi:hypothetical protein